MGLIAVASAKGSPGVTTTALLLGGLWPRMAVVAECDPSGGDVAWRMPGMDGRSLDPQGGLLNLVAAGRKSMDPSLVLNHSQWIVGGLGVVTGIRVPEQAGGVTWPDLAKLFSAVPGVDVIADLGRIGAQTPQNVLLASAHAVVMVVDTVPSNVIHLRERLGRLQQELGGPMAPPVHVAVVAPARRDRAVREVREVLEQAEARVEAVHHITHDPVGAGFFLGQIRGRADRTPLARSGVPVAHALAARTAPAYVEDTGPAEEQRA
ncbi:hypothetical protein AB3X52_13280 [Nocardioides sp. DS6]|uniref:ParA family protein n=1 Tax=Nocardioides eburneus TaxID=3231482 RepID=A0ABV3T1V0_9ACTN